ncbi:MAG: TIGR04255 family protein [Candidatus Riflebacteria bacterium]|nr:TIGR04255 family protein [Candidatus Riflebacteria bacterium]
MNIPNPGRQPEKIAPDPILQALVELRFEPAGPPDAIFGMVYGRVKDLLGEAKRLPFLDIPEALRNADPGLLFQPHYSFQREALTFQVGPRVMVFAVHPYPGGTVFLRKVREILDALSPTELCKTPVRLGLRYINFFPGNVLPRTTLGLTLDGGSLIGHPTVLQTEFVEGKSRCRLHAVFPADALVGGKRERGTIIDIDGFRTPDGIVPFSSEGIMAALEELRILDKRLFFSLLQEEFLASLHPVFQEDGT